MLRTEIKKELFKDISYGITALFCLLIALTLISWYIFSLQNGFTLKATVYFGIPNYSPHAFDILLFSFTYLIFFRKYGNRAIIFFMLAVCLSEVIGNDTQYATLLSNPTLAFSNIPPFEGWIYWDKVIIWLSATVASIIILKPTFAIKRKYLIFPLLWLTATPLTLLPSYQEWELAMNALYLASFLAIVHE